MRAFGKVRSCVVQTAADEWSLYVRADSELIAAIVSSVGADACLCRPVDDEELVAADLAPEAGRQS